MTSEMNTPIFYALARKKNFPKGYKGIDAFNAGHYTLDIREIFLIYAFPYK